MSYEDVAILAACTILFTLIIAMLPRGRTVVPLERPQAQPLEFDPLSVDADGPILDLKAA